MSDKYSWLITLVTNKVVFILRLNEEIDHQILLYMQYKTHIMSLKVTINSIEYNNSKVEIYAASQKRLPNFGVHIRGHLTG